MGAEKEMETASPLVREKTKVEAISSFKGKKQK